jgi:DNA (cytosine-5)-methyltransferase 1
MENIEFIDLFAGAGGFTIGFVEEGYKVVLAIDISEACEESYRANFPNTIFLRKDIRYLHSSTIKEYIKDIDLIIASPPCESFTTISQNLMPEPIDRLYTDPRGRLTLRAIELIGDLKPKVFIIENVPGILIQPIPKFIKKELRRIGYEKIYFNYLKAHDYGCPSVRKRIFISNIKIQPEKYDKNIVVEEALKDLPDPRYPNGVPNHEYIILPERFRNRISRIRWGQSLDYFLGGNKREYKQYIRLHPRKLAPIVMGKSRFIHPYEDRLITVREQARLMGYPDNHIFKGGISEQYNQVGESVPPPLSRAIAKVIKEYI